MTSDARRVTHGAHESRIPWAGGGVRSGCDTYGCDVHRMLTPYCVPPDRPIFFATAWRWDILGGVNKAYHRIQLGVKR